MKLQIFIISFWATISRINADGGEEFMIKLNKLNDERKLKEIEEWLIKINEKEIELRKRNPFAKTTTSAEPMTTTATTTTVDMAAEDDPDYSDYEDIPDDIDYHYIFEDKLIGWNANISHEASRILNETKDLIRSRNKTMLRLLELYSIAGALYYFTPKERLNLTEAERNMKSKFLSAIKNGSKTCPQRPTIYNLVMKDENCTVLKCIWESWNDEVGGSIRSDFEEIVKLANEAAKANGYKNVAEVWKIQDAENEDATAMMINLMGKILPLYKELHAYVRWKLSEYYSKQNKNGCLALNAKGPIPAHLTGNLINQEWSDLIDIVLPYPETPFPNFKKLLERKEKNKSTQSKMARDADRFFNSLGFEKMTKNFWKLSQFNKTSDDEYGCHPYAEDYLMEDSYSIKMCSNFTIKDYGLVHHEMGHIVAWMETKDLPYRFSHESNNIFGEGLGDSMALSATTITHLRKVFSPNKINKYVCSDNSSCQNQEINALMRSALYHIPLIPYSFVVEQWRYKVFCGVIQPDEYNKRWWEMRLEYQGIEPPSNRSEKDKFDPGSIIHIAINMPYAKYFFSLFVQFQMHKELCKISKHNGLLHQCDIYNSKEAGNKLKEILKQGGSKSTIDLLHQLTNSTGYNADPILEYYEPLMDWLKKENENKKYVVGWNGQYSISEQIDEK